MNQLEFLFVLLLAAAGVVRVAQLVHVPFPIALFLGGLAVGLIPGLPRLELGSEVIFLVFLPPLLTAASTATSPRALRAELAALQYLAVGLVLMTMALVAVVAHAALPALTWPAAFVLGAVVAPTDPVAAAATFARLGVPERVKLLVEGESIVNDATALAVYGVAVTAAVTGAFSAPDAIVGFVVTSTGGAAVGLIVAVAERRLLRRLDDLGLSVFFTVLIPYGVYILAEQLGLSGVLAVVACGLYLGWFSYDAFDADVRLNGIGFWRVLDFAANAILFVLLGLQFPPLLEELQEQLALGDLIGAALLVSLAVIATRMVATALPVMGGSVRERLVVGWSGMRGAISLAAALALPAGVQGREEILFITVVVLVVTLVGQGLSLPALLAACGLPTDMAGPSVEADARRQLSERALARLDEFDDDDVGDGEAVEHLRGIYQARLARYRALSSGSDDTGLPEALEPRRRYLEIRREVLAVERATLVDLRQSGQVDLETFRAVERELDLDEAGMG